VNKFATNFRNQGFNARRVEYARYKSGKRLYGLFIAPTRRPKAAPIYNSRIRRQPRHYNFSAIPWRRFQDPIIGVNQAALSEWLKTQRNYDYSKSLTGNLESIGGPNAVATLLTLQGSELGQQMAERTAREQAQVDQSVAAGMFSALPAEMQAMVDKPIATPDDDFDFDWDLDEILGTEEVEGVSENFLDAVDDMWSKGFADYGDNPDETAALVKEAGQFHKEQSTINKEERVASGPTDLDDFFDDLFHDRFSDDVFDKLAPGDVIHAPDGSIISKPEARVLEGGLGTRAPQRPPGKQGIWTWRPGHSTEGLDTMETDGWLVIDSTGETYALVPYNNDDDQDTYDSIICAYEIAKELSGPQGVYSTSLYDQGESPKPAPGLAIMDASATVDTSTGTYIGFKIKGLREDARLAQGNYKMFLDGELNDPEAGKGTLSQDEIGDYLSRYMLPIWVTSQDGVRRDSNRERYDFLGWDDDNKQQSSDHRRLAAGQLAKSLNPSASPQTIKDAMDGAKYQVRMTSAQTGETTNLLWQSDRTNAILEVKSLMDPEVSGTIPEELLAAYKQYPDLAEVLDSAGMGNPFHDWQVEIWRAPSHENGLQIDSTLATRIGSIIQPQAGQLQLLEDI